MTAAALRNGRLAAAEDLFAIPDDERFHEIIGGELVRKAVPSAPHGRAQLRLGGRVSRAYDRRPGGRWPGGWWFATEVEVQLEDHEIYRPDIAGWRRDRMPAVPKEVPIRMRPDWICEVLSRSNASNDTVKKMRTYHRAGVPYYWIVDPDDQTFTVYRWTPEGYLVAVAAQRGDRVRAEPLEAIEIKVDSLFAEDDDED